MDFTVIGRAGLTQEEFARIVGVSRVTANTWVRSRMAPHRYMKGRVEKLLGFIHVAIERGTLPLQANVQKTERPAAIHAALVDASTAPSAAPV